MARLPRYVIPNQPQHIIQRGNNRQVIFAADADYQFFRDAMLDAANKYGLQIHAYVWMTNHIHLLATPLYENSISKAFQSVGRKYVQYFNYTYRRSGTLWQTIGDVPRFPQHYYPVSQYLWALQPDLFNFFYRKQYVAYHGFRHLTALSQYMYKLLYDRNYMPCTSFWHHRRIYQLKLVIHARKPHGHCLAEHIF